MKLTELFLKQKNYFNAQNTKNVDERLAHLNDIRSWIIDNEERIAQALYEDLGKTDTEAYMTEIGMVLDCLSYVDKNLKKWTKKQKVKTSLSLFPAKSYTIAEPYGVVLVMSPWNYPFLLSMEPLINAIAAGNTVILKPSEYAISTSALLKEMLSSLFEEDYVAVVNGDARIARELLQNPFDYIFFTGSPTVGEVVYRKAAAHLTPVTLELGGKSPCIVTPDSDLRLAAKRIAFGKFLNAGQTCVAPDYVFVHESIKEEFISYLDDYIHEFFGDHPIASEYLCKIINRKHFNRIINLINDDNTLIIGGQADEKNLKISPTVVDNVKESDPIMQQEIFGPLLPIMTYNNIYDVATYINRHEKPLALYLFTENENEQDFIMSNCSFGGGCINDTIMQLASHHLPFGGVGRSGLGAYHGKYSFKTFSHIKSILHKSNKADLEYRYYPFDERKTSLIKKNLK